MRQAAVWWTLTSHMYKVEDAGWIMTEPNPMWHVSHSIRGTRALEEVRMCGVYGMVEYGGGDS